MIAVRTPRDAWVAADSKRAVWRVGLTAQTCKFRRLDDHTLVAFSGISTSTDRLTGQITFDLGQVVKDAYRTLPQGKPLQFLDRRIAHAVAVQIRAATRDFDSVIPNRSEVVTVLYLRALPSGLVKMRASRFFVPLGTARFRLGVSRIACPPECEINEPTLFVAGSCSDVVPTTPPEGPLTSQVVVARLREIAVAASAAKPDTCGPPISIAHVSAAGIEWIDRGECRDE